MAEASEATATTIVGRVTEGERAALVALARRHDRTPSREVRRAVRFYIARYREAERYLGRALDDAHPAPVAVEAMSP
jgi:hypothetical protein